MGICTIDGFLLILKTVNIPSRLMKFSFGEELYNPDRRNFTELLVVYLSVLAVLIPIIVFRDFTPANELRYLSIADESLASGRWWAFTNHGVAYADKPPLYLWCIMLGKLLLGSHYMCFYSLFSVLPAFVIAVVMDRWTGSYLSKGYRNAAILMLFSCGLFGGMMFTVRMDMMMTMFIVLALYQFAKLVSSPEQPSLLSRLLFALWIFLAVFTKGPMGILIPLIATFAWFLATKSLRLWSRAWGWPTWTLLILLCAVWFGMVYAEGGVEYLDNLLVHQTVGRAVNSFHHKRPIWYYFVSLTYTLQPWTLIIFGTIVYALVKFRNGLPALERFFLVIIISSLVVLSLISSKLQVYMLPAYPFMVYLAILICRNNSGSRLVKLGVAIPAALFAAVGIAGFVYWLAFPYEPWKNWLPVAAVILLAGAAAVFWWLYRRSQLDYAISVLSITVLAMVFCAGFAIVDLNPDIGYRKLAEEALKQKSGNPMSDIYTWKIDRAENIDVYLKEIPFHIEEASDSVASMPLRTFPAVVVTRTEYEGEVPCVRLRKRVGRNFAVLVCDTAGQADIDR